MIKPLSASWLGQSCALSVLSHLTSNHVLVKTENAGKETLKCEGEQREELGWFTCEMQKRKKTKGGNSNYETVRFILLLEQPQGHYENE